MLPVVGGRRGGRALLVLLASVAAAAVLAGARDAVSGTAGLPASLAPLVAAVQWLLWLLAAYVVVVAGGAAALVAFGRPRRARVLLAIVPAVWRPALAAALGVALTAGPAVAATPPGPAPATGLVAITDPFDWAAPADAAARITASVGAPPSGTDAGGRRAPPRHMRPPVTRAGHERLRTVRVRAGDCLWSLAAHDLVGQDGAARERVRRSGPRPAEIAVAWRRWYAVNRATIGPDPGLLHPGEVLRVPRPPSPPHPSNRTTRRPT